MRATWPPGACVRWSSSQRRSCRRAQRVQGGWRGGRWRKRRGLEIKARHVLGECKRFVRLRCDSSPRCAVDCLEPSSRCTAM